MDIIKMNDGEYDDDEISLNDSLDFDSDVHSSDNYEDDDDSGAEEPEIEVPHMKGVANAMNKILSSKETGKSIILSKAGKDDKKRKLGDDENNQEIDDESKKKRLEKRKEKIRLNNMAREIPKCDSNPEKEKNLRIMATQGVVQLFSAITKHKVELGIELRRAKTSNQRDKVLANRGLDNFMNILEKKSITNKKNNYEELPVKKEEDMKPIKMEDSDSKPKWNAFAKEFYKEPVLNDWDKIDSDEN